MKTQECKKCKKIKLLEDFSKSKHTINGYRTYCKECMAKKDREYYREKLKSEEFRKRKTKRNRQWVKNNPEKAKEAYRNSSSKRRLEVLKYYSNGTLKCACCGENEIKFLSIDHINNDGAEHRRKTGDENGSHICSWIIKNNFPKGFQVLCYNCNFAKGHYGICPHKLK